MCPSDDDLACPVCGRPMRLLTIIRRVPGGQTLVLTSPDKMRHARSASATRWRRKGRA
jgi:hypothetical protein